LINHPWHTEAMRLDLTDEEAAALLSLLNRVIADNRYPLSPRIGCCAPSARSYRCSIGTAAGETADTRRTYARASAPRWPAAALDAREVDC
jgi:hypothetical protein